MTEPCHAVVAICHRDDQVLLLERTTQDKSFQGWCFPGGKVDPGENTRVACLRELWEETGLTGEIYGSLPQRLSYNPQGKAYQIDAFFVRLDSPTKPIRLSPREHQQYRFCGVQEALQSLPLSGGATRSFLVSLSHPEAATVFYPLVGTKPLFPDAVGKFGVQRRHEYHSGVDLYCEVGTLVCAVQDGVVVAIENFTGPDSTPPSPWWNPTQAVLVQGSDGVVVYGEITAKVQIGQVLRAGEVLGVVDKPVLKNYKGRPTTMLHLELLTSGATKSEVWGLDQPCPPTLRNPLGLLLMSTGGYQPQFSLQDYHGDLYRGDSKG